MQENITTYRFYLLLLGFIFTWFPTIAQDLSHYTLGEAELKNAEIYSVLQAKDQRLFVATDEGLYEYKHGKMQVITSAVGQRGTSLFNLRENSKGDIYCYNLNGQIFKVLQNKLELFSQIPKHLISQNLDMEFDDEDNIVFVSEGCFIVNGNTIKILYDDKINRAAGVSKMPDGNLVLSKPNHDTIISIRKGKLHYTAQNEFTNSTSSPIYIYTLNKKYISSNTLNAITTKNGSKKLSKLTRYLQFNDSIIWRRNPTSGVEIIAEVNDKIKVTHSYFENIFISEIAKGPTGLLFFGTFGKGLKVVPNLKAQEHTLNTYGKNIQSIAVDEQDNVFISDRVNGIFKFNKDIEIILASKKFVPQKIFSLNHYNSNIHRKFPNLFYNSIPTSNITQNYLAAGALKNVTEINSETLLLSTSLGVIKYGPTPIISDTLWNTNEVRNGAKLTWIKERCSDAVFDKENSRLYISTISSLIEITADGKRKKLLFNNKTVVANDLLFYKGKLWVATQDYGILIYELGKLVKHFGVNSSLGNSYVYKLEERDGIFYISHKTGFQIYNSKKNQWRTIGKPEGIDSGTIEDFALGGKHIWFAANTKLFSLPIDNLPAVLVDFTTKIDSIKVGEKLAKLNENETFSHTENELSVVLDFKGILFEKEAHYYYKLEGLDKTIKQIPVTQATINYNFLPSGTYIFKVFAQYRDTKSETLQYAFTIEKPFWQTWWFITAISICILLLIALFTLSRNKKLKKSNQERLEKQLLKTDLVESELKALRAQMNPHFIFNSLNSIQDLILQEDTEASYDYIVLFSDLVRNALNYSNESFISLQDEIEFLETYLKLEKLRFGDDFTFTIINNVNTSLKVPSLLVQPFVENAIVHGLFHKEGLKSIHIQFETIETTLLCTITDNGIGRKKSQTIKERQGKSHESFALSSITKRLKILGEKHHQNIGFTLEDVIVNTIFEGTKVILKLPLIN